MRLAALATFAALIPLLATVVPGHEAGAQDAPAPQLPSVALPPELDRVLRDYEAAWRRGDAAALAALFAEDGFVLQGGRAPVRGRAAIRAAYEGHGGSPLRLRALAAATADTVGYIVGAYGYGSDPGDQGKFTLTLRRAPGGRWLVFSDMDNASRPPRPAAGTSQADTVAVVRAIWDVLEGPGGPPRSTGVLWFWAPATAAEPRLVPLSAEVREALVRAGVPAHTRRPAGDDTIVVRLTDWRADPAGIVVEARLAWTTVLGTGDRRCRTGSGNTERFWMTRRDGRWVAEQGPVVHGDRACVPIQ